MNKSLLTALKEHGDLLVDGVVRQLDGPQGGHYRRLQGGQLRTRMTMLHDAFVHAVASGSDAFTTYVLSITGERVAEGFPLHEVQLALRVYEESVWRLVTVHVPEEQRIECLAMSTGVVGAAKDELALAYMNLLEHARAAAPDTCAVGTDPAPLTEDDRASGGSLARRIASLHRNHRHEDASNPETGR